MLASAGFQPADAHARPLKEIIPLEYEQVDVPVGQDIAVVEHRVKWFETLSTIAEKYHVSEEEILAFNNLTEEDVITKMVLRIPLKGQAAAAVRDSIDANARNLEEALAEEQQAQQEEEEEIITYDAANPLKVSLVLPFKAGSGSPASSYFDFYGGALLALQKMKERGANVVLNVYDSEANKAADLFEDLKFVSSDLIIGPARAAQFAEYAELARENEIPIVSPMDQASDALVDGNPYIFQVPVSPAYQTRNMLDGITAARDEKVMVFYESSMVNSNYVQVIFSGLEENGIQYEPYGYDLLQGRTLSETLHRKMSPETKYKVIVASENDAFAPDVVRNMRVMHLFNIPVEIFCSNKVRNFSSIDADSFYELSAHVNAPYFIDYDSAEVKDFILKFRALYNYEPTQFSFQGYDIFTYFITQMYAYGSDFVKHADRYPMELFQSNISFVRDNEESGWHNSATRNLIYNEDFSISIEK